MSNKSIDYIYIQYNYTNCKFIDKNTYICYQIRFKNLEVKENNILLQIFDLTFLKQSSSRRVYAKLIIKKIRNGR